MSNINNNYVKNETFLTWTIVIGVLSLFALFLTIMTVYFYNDLPEQSNYIQSRINEINEIRSSKSRQYDTIKQEEKQLFGEYYPTYLM